MSTPKTLRAPLPHKITAMRGRDKHADLATVGRLWLSDAYVRAHLGDVTGKALDAMGIERPPMWDAKTYNRLARYVGDLVQAVPHYLHALMPAA